MGGRGQGNFLQGSPGAGRQLTALHGNPVQGTRARILFRRQGLICCVCNGLSTRICHGDHRAPEAAVTHQEIGPSAQQKDRDAGPAQQSQDPCQLRCRSRPQQQVRGTSCAEGAVVGHRFLCHDLAGRKDLPEFFN